MITTIKLTVFFSEPFWVGVFEVKSDDSYKICKVTFGTEPRDEEVYEFILKEFENLKFSNSTEILNNKSDVKKENPKRIQREIKKEVKNQGIGTKAQVALKKQYEENKLINKKNNKDIKNEMKERKFQLKQMKKKQKHRGH